jgi:hypothetical protein
LAWGCELNACVGVNVQVAGANAQLQPYVEQRCYVALIEASIAPVLFIVLHSACGGEWVITTG